MRVLVTGGAGFIGDALVSRLHHGALLQQRLVSLITVIDRRIERAPESRLRLIEGDVADPATLVRGIDVGVDCVFHLASVPGGAAERDFELGMRVNVHATLNLLEAIRVSAMRPVLVFASSIGVYGVPMPDVIDEATIPLPTLSYGTQKLIGEYLVADYSRRGFVDGRSVRIPGIVARPCAAGMLSQFLSDLIIELSAGRRFVCPVAAEGRSWLMSRPCVVENLIHAASLPAVMVARQRSWLLPVQHLAIGEVVAAIARLKGAQVLGRVRYSPNAALQAQFANYPPLRCPTSQTAGFRHDGSAEALVMRALQGFV